MRVDSHAYSGYCIPPYYDSMIGKLIVHGKDRAEALIRCRRALHEFLIEGVDTTVEFASFLLSRDDIIRGNYDTGYLERLLEVAPPHFHSR